MLPVRMELSARDAMSALGGAGVASTVEATLRPEEGGLETREPTPTETLLALAEVLYPSDVEVTEAFVETYLFGRIDDDGGYWAEVTRGAAVLDDWAHAAHDAPFAALSVDERDALLEDMGVRLVDPVPDGTDLERLHYHLVEELLVAFYSSPTGRELVGAEHRGGGRQSASRPKSRG